jgi:hypothetical protein
MGGYKNPTKKLELMVITEDRAEFINKNNLPFAEGNAIKYLCRHKQKGQKEDLLKAKHYIDMAIERDYD